MSQQSDFEESVLRKVNGVDRRDLAIMYIECLKCLTLVQGKMKHIVIDVKVLPVTEDVIGDYFNSPNFKQRFQSWLNDLWLEKDKRLQQLLGN